MAVPRLEVTVARSGTGWLMRSVRTLPPVYFALVMGTGIVSRGLLADGWTVASRVLLGIGLAAFGVLLVGTVLRLVWYRAEVLADEVDPARSFAFFTFVAGAGVLGSRLASDGVFGATMGFIVIGGAAWVALGYVLPAALIVRHGMRPALAGADGTWFLWIVGAQSIVVAITSLPASTAGWLAPLSVAGWSVGVMLYVAVAVLVLGRLFIYPVEAGQLTPSYWVFMGATAITALAGAKILRWVSSPLIDGVSPFVAGFSFVFWAFGTWVTPLLVALTLYHERSRLPLVYEPGLWSIVFPVGMYAVGTSQLGAALGVHWMKVLGSGMVYVAAALWLFVFLGMLASWLRAVRDHAAGSRTGSPAAR